MHDSSNSPLKEHCHNSNKWCMLSNIISILIHFLIYLVFFKTDNAHKEYYNITIEKSDSINLQFERCHDDTLFYLTSPKFKELIFSL